MMQARRALLPFMLLVLCCGSPRSRHGDAPGRRAFPGLEIPAAYTDDADRIGYACAHFWDGYLAGDGVTDSALVLGVPRPELEQAISNYIAMLWLQPLAEAQGNVKHLFERVSAVQLRDTASQFYTQFAQTAATYFYDPNSPMRDEDLWLPFAQGLAESPLTREDMRTAYRFEAESCAICPRGSTAPDIRARRPDGRIFSLLSIRAEHTILFFTNPGCHACKEIIDQIDSNLGGLVADGSLAVANIYIDEDYAAWKAYAGNYPAKWYTGFDYGRTVREKRTYDVRAIPSVYLLDADKTIILKDAPFERVLEALKR